MTNRLVFGLHQGSQSLRRCINFSFRAISRTSRPPADVSLKSIFQDTPDPSTSVLNKPGEQSIGDFLRSGSGLTKDSMHFMARFDALLAANQIVAAESFFNDQRRRNAQIDPSRYDMLCRAWAEKSNHIRAMQIFRCIEADNITPSTSTFAFLSMVYLKNKGEKGLIEISKLGMKYGVKEQDIVDDPLLSFNERKNIHDSFKNLGVITQPPIMHDNGSVRPTFSMSSLTDQWNRETEDILTFPVLLTCEEAQKAGRLQLKNQGESRMGLGFLAWKDKLTNVLEREKERYLKMPKGREADIEYGLFLFNNNLPMESVAVAALVELERHMLWNEYGAKVVSLAGDVGRAVFKKHFITENLNRGLPHKISHIYPKYEAFMRDSTRRSTMTLTQCWRKLEDEYYEEFPQYIGLSDEYVVQWPIDNMMNVGATIVNYILEIAYVDDLHEGAPNVPAFFHTYDFDGAHKIGFIKAHDYLHELFAGTKSLRSAMQSNDSRLRRLEASLLPMITLPKPWVGLRQGPYLITPANMMRCNEDTFQHFALLANANHSLSEVYDALNYISSCPWNVNKTVFDVANTLFQSGEGYKDLDFPPSEIKMPDKPPDNEMSLEEKREYARVRRLAKKARIDNSSQRSELTIKLSLAAQLLSQTFYFPHNMDFRGRAYVIPPYITHIGNDLSRALLLFADKKPLGQNGLNWLKIHLANVYGKNKVSFDDRAKFADDNMEDILDTADNPLGPPRLEGSGKWWRMSDEPWQTLAVCKEIANAIRSNDHTKFMSGFPVHQDGTCNGLQHYAALGGDFKGAQAVNLTSSENNDKPMDVYAVVCSMVNKLVDDHSNGIFADDLTLRGGAGGGWVLDEKERQRVSGLAKGIKMHGPIQRKVIKQTVMTIVYGVTFTGGRDQIARQLKNQDLLPKPEVYDTATYLTTCVFQSIGEMFTSAQALQKWLCEMARIIALSGEPVAWITPLGLPIVQPYHKVSRKLLPTTLQGLTLVNTSDPASEPNARKQETAFPPNFIHSLDSSHMMYTANACQKDDVQFVAVHDSYWTHACSVDTMRRHCREQFVRLHESPILETLSQFFKIHYQGREYVDIRAKGNRKRVVDITAFPPRGSFDVRQVLKSKYFFN